MTSKSGFLVFILIASGCLSKACGDGEISTSPRSFEAAPTPDQPIVDERTPDQSDVAGKALEPENTQGDSWETIYEKCTTDDYPAGYRPPLFVRPTLQNTGANCPDKASGCPATVTLTERTTDITAPGVYENFYHDSGGFEIKASGVTLRNFEITCPGSGGTGIKIDAYRDNLLIEYGTVKKHTNGSSCGWGSQTGKGGNIRFSNMHMDQQESDGFQSAGQSGPIMVERTLFTRMGDNGGFFTGNTKHADAWQYMAPVGESACFLGSRVVPSYCPNLYKMDNATQNGMDPPGHWYIYNNWLDGAANVMLAGGEKVVRNNKLGHYSSAGVWFNGSTINNGGNVWECNGELITDGQGDSPQATCPWGFSNNAVNGWDGQNWVQGKGPVDSNNDQITCSGTPDDRPVDPTEFCTSDGSGCVDTP